MKNILVIDDETAILDTFEQIFSSEKYKILKAETAEQGLHLIKTCAPDVVFSDIALPGKSGLQLLKEIHEYEPLLPVIIMTGTGTMRTAIEAAQSEAFEYILKPFNIDQIHSLAEKTFKVKKVEQRRRSLKIEPTISYAPGEIIGITPLMLDVFKQIGDAVKSPKSMPILLFGEYGTGKGLVARAIHNSGDAHFEPFIKVKCPAFEENLLEQELFGCDIRLPSGEMKMLSENLKQLKEAQSSLMKSPRYHSGYNLNCCRL